MKKLILIFIAILFSIGVYSQNSAYGKIIYQDYGTFRLENNRNVISVSAFVTIEEEENINHEEVELQMAKKYKKDDIQLQSTKSIEYHYELYMVSKSIFEGDTTSTWLYGTKIFINGENVLKEQFPDGFVVSIKTEPTLIYTYHANNKNVRFEITFEKSIYEPRIRK